MKKRPLFIQIWLVFAVILLTVSLAIGLVLPSILKSFFTKEAYRIISLSHEMVLNQFSENIYRDTIGPDFFGENKNLQKLVNHIIITNNGRVFSSDTNEEFVTNFAEALIVKGIIQGDKTEYYSEYEGKNLIYTLSKAKILGRDGLVCSYIDESYRYEQVKDLYKKIILILLVVLVFSIIPAFILAKYLSRPLVELERRVNDLANNNREDGIDMDRDDEIGKLSLSIEHLRQQLINQDMAEKTFIQNVSHELKTPVMVIQGYTEAIKDGIYPKGEIGESLEVILSEADKLNAKIGNLILYNKLDYLSSHEQVRENFSLDDLINSVAERLKFSNNAVEISLDLEKYEICSNYEQWEAAIENILDNQLKYAKTKINISMSKKEGKEQVIFYNDGRNIDSELMEIMFQRFKKSEDGSFGLGLAIAKKVMEISGWEIRAENISDGVLFILEEKM